MSVKLSSQRKKSSRGSGILEGALVLSLFSVLFIAIVDLAQLLFVHQFLTERVRAASRYAVVNTYDAAAIQNMVMYGQPDDPGTGSAFGVNRSMVQVSRVDAGTSQERITVTLVNYPIHFFTPITPGAANGGAIAATVGSEMTLQ